MPAHRVDNWPLLPLRLLLATLVWLFRPSVTQAVGYSNEVTVWIELDQAVATSLVSGRREIPFDAQETVIGLSASGINAVVATSRRLLGFSSRTLAWSKTDRDLNEKVLERRVLPTFSVVRTDKPLYGFRGANGIWLDETLEIRETVTMMQPTDYGAVFVTNDSWALPLCSATSLHRHSASTNTSHAWTTNKGSSSSPQPTAPSFSAAA